MGSQEYAGQKGIFLLSEDRLVHKQNTIYKMGTGMDVLCFVFVDRPKVRLSAKPSYLNEEIKVFYVKNFSNRLSG